MNDKLLLARLDHAKAAEAAARTEVDKILLELIELRARAYMKDNPEVKEFVMAMGSATFNDGKNCLYDSDLPPGSEAVFDLINKYDEDYHITGVPMRFTATGPVVTDW